MKAWEGVPHHAGPQHLLRHHADLLRERRAPYRACLYDAFLRRTGPVHAPRRARRSFPDGHRRARPEDRDRVAGGRARSPGVHRQGEPVVPRSRGQDELQPRQFHPHHRAAALQGMPGSVGEARRLGRYLSRQVCRLVLGARRGLLCRGRDRDRTGQEAPRHFYRRGGHLGRGAVLLLQALGVGRAAARIL